MGRFQTSFLPQPDEVILLEKQVKSESAENEMDSMIPLLNEETKTQEVILQIAILISN